MIISETQPPPPNAFGDTYERGLDPWHADAFPAEFKHAGTIGERKAGWYLVDWCGNAVGFIPDGAVVIAIAGGIGVVKGTGK